MNTIAHTFGVDDHQNDATATAFHQQRLFLTTIQLLCRLTRAVQHHRGGSMAYLSGDQTFLNQLNQCQSHIQTLFSTLQLTQDFTQLHEALINLANNWETIRLGWEHDGVMHNFEFHSHLLDEIKKLMRQCMQSLLTDSRINHRHKQLLQLQLGQAFDNIESLARLRGLSTNAAIIKACGEESHARISFLLKVIPEQNQQLLKQYLQLKTEGFKIDGIEVIKQQSKSLNRLLLSIQIQILESDQININGSELFSLATEIIEQRWQALGQGLQLVEHNHFDSLIQL
ncbi:hypothetical protein [Oceanicoccus sp. KOV_DT_Chl]|uniref:hypothetical protein n=1 Tax=Oceanicoccus sp. KOV_DT_Chl TaxID=1904639 RepID=UPI000C7A0DFD|nr:hypothetical protein [Oceanicoccus sp. KOV_DT_Chl]